MQNFTEAAKALVRASYTAGKFTGPEDVRAAVNGIAAWLQRQNPVGPVSRDDAARLLGRGDVHVTKLVPMQVEIPADTERDPEIPSAVCSDLDNAVSERWP